MLHSALTHQVSVNQCKKMIASASPVVDKVEHVFRKHIHDFTNLGYFLLF